jgi:CheY-like chemotaxis protein
MPAPPPGAPLVLIVDDNPDNRDVYATFLAYKGYRTETAADGLEGLLKAGLARPAVIVMDLAMPRLDGWEAMRLLRASPNTRDIPLICLSGFTALQDRQRALAAGADLFLAKPLVPEELLEALRTVLTAGEAARDAGA